jgi:uncharacterized membrane protein
MPDATAEPAEIVAAGPAPPCRRIELLPNCSLSPRSARLFFASVCLCSLTVALLFVARGFWPVLPFAGLELALLGWALAVSLGRRHCTQTVEIDEAHVTVITRQRHDEQKILFSRHWAKVTLRGPRGWQPGRLLIGSHGRTCEVGSFLTEEARRALGERLRVLIGRTSDSPPLSPPGTAGGAGRID